MAEKGVSEGEASLDEQNPLAAGALHEEACLRPEMRSFKAFRLILFCNNYEKRLESVREDLGRGRYKLRYRGLNPRKNNFMV